MEVFYTLLMAMWLLPIIVRRWCQRVAAREEQRVLALAVAELERYNQHAQAQGLAGGYEPLLFSQRAIQDMTDRQLLRYYLGHIDQVEQQNQRLAQQATISNKGIDNK
jgi:hypothetical protein